MTPVLEQFLKGLQQGRRGRQGQEQTGFFIIKKLLLMVQTTNLKSEHREELTINGAD